MTVNRTSFRYRLEQNLWFNPSRPTAIKLTKQSKLAEPLFDAVIE